MKEITKEEKFGINKESVIILDESKDKICYFKEHANDKALSYDDLCDLLNPVKGILKDNSSLLDYYSKELEQLKGKVKETTKIELKRIH